MWALLFLLGFGGVLVQGDDLQECMEKAPRCPSPDIEFPTTKEELVVFCPVAVAHLDCMKNREEGCGYPEGEYYVGLPRILSTLREVCREDSLLHAAVGENIACISRTLKGEIIDNCDKRAHEVRKMLHQHERGENANEEEGEVSQEEYRKTMCIRDYYNTACVTKLISDKCGPVARSTALEIFGRIRFFDDVCEPHHAKDFSEVIPLLDITDEEKSNLLEVFQLK